LDTAIISTLLVPYLGHDSLNPIQLEQTHSYLALLLKWNARINLTAVRTPEEIVRRHFGESFFAAQSLFPAKAASGETLIDLGSGAGFPGLPIKILIPALQVTLIESQNKKATFLKEAIRALQLKDTRVYAGRAEDSGLKADTVTMRAVEKFQAALPIACSLLKPNGRLALLIGAPQTGKAKAVLPNVEWEDVIAIPGSEQRVLLTGRLVATL
jgi:16S rRNA (guanine527-N7)-methyltransferase